MKDKKSPRPRMQMKSPNTQKNRLNLELNQIRSILNDFRKTKYKCQDLAKCIGEEMPEKEKYQSVQRATLRKMELLDVAGLVGLKNELVRSLTELFEMERELRYRKEKYEARRAIMNDIQGEREYSVNQATSAIEPPQKTSVQESKFRSTIQEPSPESRKEQRQSVPQIKDKKLHIPLYRAKNESNENKLDRISKYLALIKRNMKLNCETVGYRWKTKEFLMEDENYLKVRQQIEKFSMREEELLRTLSKAVSEGVLNFITQSQVLQSNSEYKLIKVYKKKEVNKDCQSESLSPGTSNLKRQSNIAFESPLRSQKLLKMTRSPSGGLFDQEYYGSASAKQIGSPVGKVDIEKKAAEDFNDIKRELEASSDRYNKMVSKISETVEKGSEKLIQLRSKRKKLQSSGNIWDELEKI